MAKGIAIQLNDPFSSGEVFDLKIDVKYDTQGKITSGLVVGPVVEQNQALLLLCNPGEIKQYPTLGVGIESMLLDNDLLGIRHKIRQSFAADGLKITTLDVYDVEDFTIKATY